MSFLNLRYGLLIYEDDTSDKNPDIRVPDISKNIEGVPVSLEKSEKIIVNNSEIKDIATTARALLWDATTEVTFDRYLASSSNIRLTYTGTGTAPVFRTNRNIGGDATSEATITRVTDYVARIQNTAGTAWALANVQVNDVIRFEKTDDSYTSPFETGNQGKQYVVQAKGADYIDFVDNGNAVVETVTLGADFAKTLKVVSQSSVRVGDTLELSGAGINPSNQGKFEIVDVSDDYVEITNPLAVQETVVLGTNTFVVYEHLIGFLHLRGSAPIKVRFGEQSEWVQIDTLNGEAIFLGSVCTHRIQAMNDRSNPVIISVQTAMVTNV